MSEADKELVADLRGIANQDDDALWGSSRHVVTDAASRIESLLTENVRLQAAIAESVLNRGWGSLPANAVFGKPMR